MAIPNNYIDKITNKDSGDSRIISPAADMVRVENENYEGADLDEVLDEISEAFSEIEHHGLVNGRVPFDEATPIVLASLDGDNTDITPYSEGDYFAVLSSEKIYQVENGAADEVGEIDDKLIYCDKATGNLYRWDYTTNQFVQVGGNSGGGSGTVTGVKMNNGQPIPPDENGVVDLGTVITDVSNKVDKETGKGLSTNDYTTTDKTKLAGIETGAEKNVISGIKANGASETLPVENGIVTLPPAGSTISPATVAPLEDGTAGVGSSEKYAREDHVHPHDTSKLSQSDVSVSSNQDGTVDINVGEDTYAINLNHTHENMAKLVITDEEPSNPAMDTIYAQVNDADTPTEIVSLWIAGLEFVGGAIPDTGMPQVTRPVPNSVLNLGITSASGVSQLVKVVARNLNYGGSTDGLVVSVDQDSDLTLSYDQTVDAKSVTIPQLAATTGVYITVKYSGSVDLADGVIAFSHANAIIATASVVARELPVGYTRLEYVDNAVRGIDTGILATDSEILTTSIEGSSWEVDVRYDSLPSVNQMLVAGNEDVSHWGGFINTVQKFGLGNDYAFSAAATVRQVITFTFWSNKLTATSNGQTVSRDYTYHNHRNVCLFRNVNPNVQQYAGFQYTGRIYSAKCVSGGSFDAVPAQRTSDNVKGLYDKANDVFYPLTA